MALVASNPDVIVGAMISIILRTHQRTDSIATGFRGASNDRLAVWFARWFDIKSSDPTDLSPARMRNLSKSLAAKAHTHWGAGDMPNAIFAVLADCCCFWTSKGLFKTLTIYQI